MMTKSVSGCSRPYRLLQSSFRKVVFRAGIWAQLVPDQAQERVGDLNLVAAPGI